MGLTRARIAYDRQLMMQDRVVDIEIGKPVVGLEIWYEFDHIFELGSLSVGEPDGGASLNTLLHVSYSHRDGLIAQADPGLECAWSACGWAVTELRDPVQEVTGSTVICESMFNRLLQRYKDLLVEDNNLQSLGYWLRPITVPETMWPGGGHHE